jgi:hypothetical protein
MVVSRYPLGRYGSGDVAGDARKMDRAWAANLNPTAGLESGVERLAWCPTGQASSHLPEKFGLLWIDAESLVSVIVPTSGPSEWPGTRAD